MVMTVSGHRRFPSAAYSVLPNGSTSFGDINVAATGTDQLRPNRDQVGRLLLGRARPLGNISVDGDRVVPPKASQTTDGAQRLGDPRHESRIALTVPASSTSTAGRRFKPPTT